MPQGGDRQSAGRRGLGESWGCSGLGTPAPPRQAPRHPLIGRLSFLPRGFPDGKFGRQLRLEPLPQPGAQGQLGRG